MSKKTVFLTGATGLVGSYLLKVLLESEHKVYVLARDKSDTKAVERIINVLRFWNEEVLGKYKCNLCVFEGDVILKDFGFSSRLTNFLQNRIEEIFHCAAAIQFNLSLEAMRETNVGGTKNVLNFASRCKKLRKINYISTAYVSGDFKGVFKEDDLDVGQGFNSTYDQSKFEAEKAIQTYRKDGLWVDVFRPPLIVFGETKVGKTITFQQNIYQLFHLCNQELFDFLPLGNFSANVVYVNELCEAVYKISSLTEMKNGNYHVFKQQKVSFDLMLDILSKALYSKKPQLVSQSEFFQSDPTVIQKMILQNNILLFNNEVDYETSKTERILKKYNFEFMGFNKKSFLKLLKFAVDAGFLKYKRPKCVR